MRIYNLNGNLLYRNSNEINQEAIVDAIVEAGGVGNINIQIDFDYFSHKESIEGIKFIKISDTILASLTFTYVTLQLVLS